MEGKDRDRMCLQNCWSLFFFLLIVLQYNGNKGLFYSIPWGEAKRSTHVDHCYYCRVFTLQFKVLWGHFVVVLWYINETDFNCLASMFLWVAAVLSYLILWNVGLSLCRVSFVSPHLSPEPYFVVIEDRPTAHLPPMSNTDETWNYLFVFPF